MSIRKRFLVRLVLLGGFGILAFLGSVLVYDAITQKPPTYAPVVQEAVIENWQPSWGESSPVSETGAEIIDSAVDEAIPESTYETESERGFVAPCNTLPKKWMMLGWDGADWDLILPLVEQGKMPHLASLMQSGTYGALQTFKPSISPAIWTTVATGVSPQTHGIRRFYNKRPRLERWASRLKNFGRLERQLYSNADRQVRAIWNELSDREMSVLMVGYHNTFPVEEIHGLMVSNYLVQDSIGELMQMRSDGGEDSPFALSLVYPQQYLREVLSIQEEVNHGVLESLGRFVDLSSEQGSDYRNLTDFVRQARQLDREGDRRPYFLMRAYTFDTILAEITERFLPKISPDMLFVHFQGLDWAAHSFLYYHQPELFEAMPWSEEVREDLEKNQPLYSRTVEAFYIYMDEWLGRFLAHRDEETAVIVLSDHGFEAGSDPQIPGYHDEAPPGILILNGPGLKKNYQLGGASVYDIFPTLMASLELPVAADLEGRVLQDVFCSEAWLNSDQKQIASYETGGRYVPAVAKPPALQSDLIDQLESLGYLK